MVHAKHYNQWDDEAQPWQETHPVQDVDDWNSLRDELENLLDQVHLQSQDAQSRTQYSDARSEFEPELKNPFQPNAPAILDRHNQALASVQRAVDRFSAPEEAITMPAQSQHQLQNAIRQIRSSQRGNMARARANSQASHSEAGYENPRYVRQNSYREPQQQQQPMHANNQFIESQFEGISGALESISGRMERFEQVLGGQQNSDSAVADMAMQVEQLSGVVEHLANNIGERGQIKRLENQIAKMADNLHADANLDFKSLNKRLDVLSGAFEKLRDLQAQQVELNIKSNGNGGYMDTIEEGVRNIYERLDGMGLDKLDLEPIENHVRTVYDRIDALEQTMATPTPTIERLSREMADFTQAMRDDDRDGQSANLVEQVGELVSRIEQIEAEGTPVGDLKIDMKELQSSVVGAMDPRFSALEDKIGALTGKFEATSKSAGGGKNTNATVATLEKHIRALAAKLDKTSNDLNGLQKVFHQQPEGAKVPDLNAIADMVALRTTEAVEKLQSQPGKGIEQKALDQLEARLSNLFSKSEKQQNPPELNQVQNSIEQVNQRLARLEATLSSQEPNGLTIKDKSDVREILDETEPTRRRAAPRRARHPGLSQDSIDSGSKPSENWEPSQHLIPELRDNMPRPPAQDGPLKAPLFEENDSANPRIPVPNLLRVDPSDLQVTESEVHEIDEPRPAKRRGETVNEDGRIKLPKFTDENVIPPPAPASSFALDARSKTQQQPTAPESPNEPAPSKQSSSVQRSDSLKSPADTHEQVQLPESPADVSRSTFIEAARRAAQSNNSDEKTPAPQSIIARAMARFQKKKPADAPVENETNSAEPRFAGDSSSQSKYDTWETKSENENLDLDDLTTVPESFLNRHRQPILLGATVIAVGFLTLNLINQRFSSSDPQPAAAVGEMSTAINDGTNSQETAPTPAMSAPQTKAASPDNGDEIIEESSIDATENGDVVGSIDRFSGAPGSPVRMIDPNITLDMPSSLNQQLSVRNASLNTEMTSISPVGLQMPPEAIGPMLLRQTAAEGDARAQFEVAAIFAEGRAIAQDLAASAIWYERAAAQGFAPASYRLANMLENGVGVTKDLASARLWYQLAADAGNRMSMHNLASLLASGQLGEQQFEGAAHWFEKAASLGLKDSQFNLGMLYARGLGVTQSLENSFKWFSIAAEAGDADAANARDDIARSLDAQIVSRIQNDVQAWAPGSMNIRANFAPIGTWSANFDPGPQIDASEVILKVQAALNGIGFDTGIPDGLIGPKTADAISGFEVETGMIPSGQVNPRLLAVLGSQPV